jgi:hypothetical protein
MQIGTKYLKMQKQINDLRKGKQTENKLIYLLESLGRKVVQANLSQDMYDHIDMFVNDVPIDVKGNRYANCIWLELTNVNGKDGWLKGKSKYIVMDVIDMNSFLVFKTKDLLEYCNNIVQIANSKNDYNMLYTRHGRKDQIIKVRYSDIKHLQKGKLTYAY